MRYRDRTASSLHGIANTPTITLQHTSLMSRVALSATCLIAVLALHGSPGLCLILGFLFGLTPYAESTTARKLARPFLAWAIIGLGATITIGRVYELSASRLSLTIVSILLTLSVGWLIGTLLKLPRHLHILIACGTAICGASAIAAVGSALKSKHEDLSMALAVILVFNTIALFLFPPLGQLLGMSPELFASWAGLAIHDTSSVVGAAIAYDPSTVDTATTVKLARAIWIAPLVLIYSIIENSGERKRLGLPWFIWGFLAMSLLVSLSPIPAQATDWIRLAARAAFAAALFLLGVSIDKRLLISAGMRPVFLGGLLWFVSAGVTALWIIN